MSAVILVIDDERGIRWMLQEQLSKGGHRVVTAENGEEALRKLPEFKPDLALVDLRMPVMDGFAFIERAHRIAPELRLIAISGLGTIEDAVKAMRLGAEDFIQKPFALDTLSKSIERALGHRGHDAAEETAPPEGIEELSPEQAGGVLIGRSRKMREIYNTIKRLTRSSITSVFIQGESGTGKELIARAIHFTSARRDKRFVAVNCAALTDNLLESELFGYEKGAFTGAAVSGKQGLFEVADEGTMFLDEIAEMSVKLQSKLLRVLQERCFKKVGGVEDIPIDVRVIASTNRNLAQAVADGSFREDLYYRLHVVPIVVPPLRERKDDIPLIAHYYLRLYSREFGHEISDITPEAYEALTSYDWPGNVRELKNVIERAVLLESSSSITTRYLMLRGHRPRTQATQTLELVDRSVATMERQLIKKVLEDSLWQRSEAARILGIHRTTLANKIKEYGLDRLQPVNASVE